MHWLAVMLVVCVACSKDGVPPAPAPEPVESPEGARPKVTATDGDRDDIRVVVQTRTDWIPVSPASAVPVRRAVRPGTLEPYDDTPVDVSGLRREFVLDKDTVFVGEPVLVDIRIELDGPGQWHEAIGGNYRGRGRDDNFAFVLRHEDGTWVRDPYTGDVFMGGGISTQYPVEAGEPRSYWHAVQRYAVIDRPGKYDLYCVQFAHVYDTIGWRDALAAAIPEELAASHELARDTYHLVEKGTGVQTPAQLSPSTESVHAPPSPVVKRLSKHLYLRLDEHVRDSVMDYAHFELTVVEPTATQRADMVAEWTRTAAVDPSVSWPTPRPHAAREAIWFVHTTDFLDLVGTWLRNDETALPQYLHGLAMNPNPEAVEVLLRDGGPDAVSALYHLRPEHRSVAVPKLIAMLTHADDGARAYAFDRLAAWSGERHGADWSGYLRGRPSVDEGLALQPKYRAWWDSRD